MVELRNKGPWRKKLLILLGCGLALVLLMTLWREREPQYKGRSLSDWIAIRVDGDPEISQQQAELAIRSIGTNGLPFYLKCFQYQERPWRTRLANQAARLPGKFGDTAAKLVLGRGQRKRQEAFTALYVLGPDAKPALPFLTQQLAGPYPEAAMTFIARMGDVGLPTILTVLTNGSATAMRSLAIETLGAQFQFTATNAVQSVVTACLEDSDREVALAAAGVLCTHKIDQDRAMQVFSEALESNNRTLRQTAGGYLTTNLRRSFSPAQLVHYLQDTNSPLSLYAADALGSMAQINMKLPENVLPALTNSLHDPRPKVRWSAVAALAYFKNAPEIVGPSLLDLWTDPDFSVRRTATNSFFQVPPYSRLNIAHLPIGMAQEQADMVANGYQTPPSWSVLASLMTHPDIRVREMATNVWRTFQENSPKNSVSDDSRH